MTVLITILHVLVAIFLILVVLLQTGKRADLAGAFGGGGSQTAFGTRGAATLLSKLTTAAAVMFMLTSLGLSILSSRGGSGGGSVLEDVAPPQAQAPAPAPVEEEDDAADFPELPPVGESPDDSEPEATETGEIP